MRYRFTAALMVTSLATSLLTLGAPAAHASSKGRRNVALGLGAIAVYELLKGKTSTGLIAGAGAAYAYKRYNDARQQERRSGRYSRRGRYDRSSYRTRNTDSGFQLPQLADVGSYLPQLSNGSDYGNRGDQSPAGGDYGNGNDPSPNNGYRSDANPVSSLLRSVPQRFLRHRSR